MTEAQMYEVLRSALTDEVMKQERLRVFAAVERRAHDLLAALGVEFVLDEPDVVERLALYKEFHHVPGDHLWQAMQFVFRVARDGADESDRTLAPEYLGTIYRTLFTSVLVKTPQIPEQWWETPLGIACRVVESGIAACADVIETLKQLAES
ncbi:hypothetical protein [Sulfoacidibacillus thermotolerans]|uniref:Uncharacterized protein n=1 Tax=Sulfoacidibacillus thermotolerans TaxID=1765684 RepID=A0A2U3D7J8_SULT2|nr:hypothetical protein [Sulfoacidibacillus thermotolerans]PWI57254.1 hypothetical protein BM613_09725 [Sulfoacidibacillus thermotolerans]